jgi:ATP phosphoribosyltransferase-like protein
MSDDKSLKIGMPAGSLANANRGGNLINLLADAGFKTKGYESGGPSKFNLFSYLYGWDGRPQEFGTQIGVNEIDVAIAGEDWIRERKLEMEYEFGQQLRVEKILSLNRGNVRIVGIIDNNNDAANIADFLKDLTNRNDIITVVSEMPYLALKWLQENLKKAGLFESFSDFSVQKYKTPAKIKKGVVIYETWGKTEAKVKNGGADIGMEITQSGSSIRNYGLKIIDEVLHSETGVYINPDITADGDKKELLNMFLLNLYGAVNAENKVMVMFNAPNDKLDEIEAYLQKNNLFGDEPSITRGKQFTEYNIQVDISQKNNPLAKIRYDLAKLDAKHIDTIPINSSIPGIEVIGL